MTYPHKAPLHEQSTRPSLDNHWYPSLGDPPFTINHDATPPPHILNNHSRRLSPRLFTGPRHRQPHLMSTSPRLICACMPKPTVFSCATKMNLLNQYEHARSSSAAQQHLRLRAQDSKFLPVIHSFDGDCFYQVSVCNVAEPIIDVEENVFVPFKTRFWCEGPVFTLSDCE